MFKKMSILLLVSVVLAVTVMGCGGGSDKPAADEEETFTIGINNFGQANFFARIGREALIDQIEKNGGKVISTVNADVPGRVASIENMIAQGVDAIIIQEGDIGELSSACLEAKKKGIIIASMDSGDQDFVDVFVESDNTELGTKSAEYLMEHIGGKGNIVEIINDAGAMIRTRKDAMHKVVEANPDVTIKSSFVYAWPDFFPDTKAKMEAVLQANPNPGDIVGVFATFDGVGVAAAQAIREAGLQEHIAVVGVDGDPEAYKEMKREDSPFIATMAQDPDTMARTCVDRVFDLLNGKELEERHIYIPGKLITKDNIPEETN